MVADDNVDIVDMKLKKEKKSKDKLEKKDKKDKKDKKRSENDGIHKEKKDKKKEKAKQEKLARVLDAHLQADAAKSEVKDEDIKVEDQKIKAKNQDIKVTDLDIKDEKKIKIDPEDLIKPAEELVPFALPLADEKTHKKIYKLIKKGAKLKSIHRGVKECEKAIKKCPPKTAASAATSDAPGLVIIAGDISPMDVIMHFPILCEEHGVPYLYVRSRADLGVAACTKRATSVVMLKPEGKKTNNNNNNDDKKKKDKKKSDDAVMEVDADNEDGGDKKVSAEEYLESWKELVKVAEKQWKIQVQPWVKGVHPLQIAEREKSRQQSSRY